MLEKNTSIDDTVPSFLNGSYRAEQRNSKNKINRKKFEATSYFIELLSTTRIPRLAFRSRNRQKGEANTRYISSNIDADTSFPCVSNLTAVR